MAKYESSTKRKANTDVADEQKDQGLLKMESFQTQICKKRKKNKRYKACKIEREYMKCPEKNREMLQKLLTGSKK